LWSKIKRDSAANFVLYSMFISHGCPLLFEEKEEKHSLAYVSRNSALLTVQVQNFTTAKFKIHKTL